jgi:large subunit ribosomal protein L32
MAVPSHKTSKSNKRARRGGNTKLNMPAVHLDPQTGEYVLSHRVAKDGTYNGRQVLAK